MGEKKKQVVIEDTSDYLDVEILPNMKNKPAEYIKEEVDSELTCSSLQKQVDEKIELKPKLDNGPIIESAGKSPEVICENMNNFASYKVQIGRFSGLQKCHFCGVHFSSSFLDQHYKASHKAYEWCQLSFPGTPAFKELSGHIECCICKFAFKNIANHLLE